MDGSSRTIETYCVAASDLDQTFVGRSFRLRVPGYDLYGRIGAIRIFVDHILLTLAEVPGDDIHLGCDEKLFFIADY